MDKGTIRIKKIEPILSQKIQNVYQYQLDHKLDRVSFRLFDRTLIVMLEGTITSPEKLLKEKDRLSLVKQVRAAIDSFIEPQIKTIIEEVLNVRVVDFLSDTTIDNDLTGAIAIIEFKPN